MQAPETASDVGGCLRVPKNIVVNQIGYWVGHRAGRELVLKWGGK